VVKIERRTLPGEKAQDVERELDELLARCRTADPELVASRRTLLVRDPLEVDARHKIVDTVRSAAAAVTGEKPEIGGVSYWADSGFVAAAGIPTVLFGPGGEGAHAVEERVSLRDTEVVARTLVEAAGRFCR
jgi:acetylornithine deacetylase